LLPLWFRVLDILDLLAQKMPQDVATRWNSTYDMLAFAVRYQSAIDDITGDKNANLRKFELNDNEWEIALELFETLKVSASFFFWKIIPIRIATIDFQGCNIILLSFHTKPRDSHPSHGFY
jgi:hypothetical protein